MSVCPEYLSATVICTSCGHRCQVIYQCPIPPEQHARTPIPDADIKCDECGSKARPEAYWNRLSQLPS